MIRHLMTRLGGCLDLGSVLEALRADRASYEIRDHWQQGEFHHDVVLEVRAEAGLFLVVATNCNGGVKEVLAFDRMPERAALWHHRCPDNPEFQGELPRLLDSSRTSHWFDPCELLLPQARSELKPEFRRRQRGGGWQCSGS